MYNSVFHQMGVLLCKTQYPYPVPYPLPSFQPSPWIIPIPSIQDSVPLPSTQDSVSRTEYPYPAPRTQYPGQSTPTQHPGLSIQDRVPLPSTQDSRDSNRESLRYIPYPDETAAFGSSWTAYTNAPVWIGLQVYRGL